MSINQSCVELELNETGLSREECLINEFRGRIKEDSKVIGELGLAVILLLLTCFLCLCSSFIGFGLFYSCSANTWTHLNKTIRAVGTKCGD